MSYVNVRIIISSALINEIYNKRECLITDCMYVHSILRYNSWDSAIKWQFIYSASYYKSNSRFMQIYMYIYSSYSLNASSAF